MAFLHLIQGFYFLLVAVFLASPNLLQTKGLLGSWVTSLALPRLPGVSNKELACSRSLPTQESQFGSHKGKANLARTGPEVL
jgi:hypothetical protein